MTVKTMAQFIFLFGLLVLTTACSSTSSSRSGSQYYCLPGLGVKLKQSDSRPLPESMLWNRKKGSCLHQ
ncbi:hypothetical protein [Pleionea sp. CnH1-48]|uniref:hypothetical protein n=1 Tax=Pleionea sp. CnH1-48 TaxID=2954494 RepID=UPI002097CA1E|nr:hypothetical protein [Pleionea sp. CnH1-48]MCO7226489.1 hypothetical protein [Pleionea sp. CnH1-48]